MRNNLLICILSGLTLVGLANAQAAPMQPGQPSSSAQAPPADVPPSAALSPSTSSSTAPAAAPANENKGEELLPTDGASDNAESDNAIDPASLLPDLPPLSKSKVTLVGGTIEKLDRVRDQLTVRPFGSRSRMKILFDARTRVYRDGQVTSPTDLKKGDRVYVDTILNGPNVFARNIRFNTNVPQGESQGAVVSFSPDRGELLLHDALSPQPMRVRLNSSTRILQGERAVPASELEPGTLVDVKFDSENNGHDVAREISVLALPGATFTFAGELVAVNLRSGFLVLNSVTDHKTYEINFDPSKFAVDDNWRQGTDVSVQTRFDGSRYTAQNVTIISPAKQ
ncbi:MAG: DUF5666 domain-containing protein [Terriglobales bacterium]